MYGYKHAKKTFRGNTIDMEEENMQIYPGQYCLCRQTFTLYHNIHSGCVSIEFGTT